MAVTLISSLRLYLNINESMNLELAMSKQFYSLAIDINKVLSLAVEDRGESGIQYLNKKYSHYAKLVESSNLLRKRFREDRLTETNGMVHFGDSSSDSSSVEMVTPHSAGEPTHALP